MQTKWLSPLTIHTLQLLIPLHLLFRSRLLSMITLIFNYIGALPTHCIKFYVRFTKTIMLNFHIFHVHIVHVYYIHILQNGWLEMIHYLSFSFFFLRNASHHTSTQSGCKSHQYLRVFKTFLMPKESIFLLYIYTPVWVVLLVQILLLNIDCLLFKWGILRIEEL